MHYYCISPSASSSNVSLFTFCVHLEVPVHEPFAVKEVHSLGDLQENVQALVVLSLLWEAALGHPVLQVLFPTELHLDVQVHLETGHRSIRFIFVIREGKI